MKAGPPWWGWWGFGHYNLIISYIFIIIGIINIGKNTDWVFDWQMDGQGKMPEELKISSKSCLFQRRKENEKYIGKEKEEYITWTRTYYTNFPLRAVHLGKLCNKVWAQQSSFSANSKSETKSEQISKLISTNLKIVQQNLSFYFCFRKQQIWVWRVWIQPFLFFEQILCVIRVAGWLDQMMFEFWLKCTLAAGCWGLSIHFNSGTQIIWIFLHSFSRLKFSKKNLKGL